MSIARVQFLVIYNITDSGELCYDLVNYQDILCAKSVSDPCPTHDGTRYPTPCRGDGGSGLMARITNSSSHDQWFVFGLDSFSDELCGLYQDSHTAYISTVQHRDWILQVRGKMQSLNWTDI